MGIPLSLLQNGAEELRDARVVNWIRHRIQHDEMVGRTQSDFTTVGLEQVIAATAPAMKRDGFDTYQGGGNVFYVRERQGQPPLVIHARPLAKRTIRLRFQ